jgi:hypothetical protein
MDFLCFIIFGGGGGGQSRIMDICFLVIGLTMMMSARPFTLERYKKLTENNRGTNKKRGRNKELDLFCREA